MMNDRIAQFQAAKREGKRLAMLTAYDYPQARLLEESGVVSRVVDGRRDVLSLRTERLEEVTQWMVRQREIWTRLFDVGEDHLKEEQR